MYVCFFIVLFVKFFCVNCVFIWKIWAGKYHEQIQIQEDSIGHSYEKMFSRFFSNEILDLIEINDPYIKSRHQVIILFIFDYKTIYYTNHSYRILKVSWK